MVHSNSPFEIILFYKKLNILRDKWEHQNSWNLLESNPITMFGDGIKYICMLCWQFIIGVNDSQHVPYHNSQLLKKGACICNPQVFKFLGWDIFSQQTSILGNTKLQSRHRWIIDRATIYHFNLGETKHSLKHIWEWNSYFCCFYHISFFCIFNFLFF